MNAKKPSKKRNAFSIPAKKRKAGIIEPKKNKRTNGKNKQKEYLKDEE